MSKGFQHRRSLRIEAVERRNERHRKSKEAEELETNKVRIQEVDKTRIYSPIMVIVIVTLVLGVLLGAFFLIPRGNADVVRPNQDKKASELYTRSEISSHNKKTDCWIIIKDKVYDVTSYVEEHPGGDAILAHAGDDSTEGFYGPQHASRVFDMVDEFYIGDLEH